MSERNEGQTAAPKVANQSRALQYEDALIRVDELMDALVDAHQRYCDALANDDELFGSAVQVALEERGVLMGELLAADQARQKFEW